MMAPASSVSVSSRDVGVNVRAGATTGTKTRSKVREREVMEVVLTGRVRLGFLLVVQSISDGHVDALGGSAGLGRLFVFWESADERWVGRSESETGASFSRFFSLRFVGVCVWKGV